MNLSVIIPVLNEEDHLRRLLCFLLNHPNKDQFEVIVVDGGSSDKTIPSIADLLDQVKLLKSDVASRAVQMNLGAKESKGDLLYFVHADVRLPHSFYEDLLQAAEVHSIGGYRYQFDSPSWLLRINSWFTRWPMMWCRGGDQTLFVKPWLFEKLDGFDERFCVMEDFDFIRRAKELAAYRIIPRNVIVSARKYRDNSYLKVQLANLLAFRMFNRGEKPENIRKLYKRRLGLERY